MIKIILIVKYLSATRVNLHWTCQVSGEFSTMGTYARSQGYFVNGV